MNGAVKEGAPHLRLSPLRRTVGLAMLASAIMCAAALLRAHAGAPLGQCGAGCLEAPRREC